MTEVLLFHHAQGLTEGVRGFADQLRAAGHTVHTPDTYEGNVFATLDVGLAYAKKAGFATVRERGLAAAESLPAGLVYAGFSLGVMAAQQLAQTRPGAAGALFFESCLPPDEFGSWPAGLPAQVHGMDADPIFALEGDLDAARALAAAESTVEVFTYPGDQHLFTDSSLPGYDKAATELLTERVLAFLAKL